MKKSLKGEFIIINIKEWARPLEEVIDVQEKTHSPEV